MEPTQDNVALIAVLEALDPPHPEAAAAGRRQLICVANTHIHANPELNDVKLWQVHPAPARGLLLWQMLGRKDCDGSADLLCWNIAKMGGSPAGSGCATNLCR